VVLVTNSTAKGSAPGRHVRRSVAQLPVDTEATIMLGNKVVGGAIAKAGAAYAPMQVGGADLLVRIAKSVGVPAQMADAFDAGPCAVLSKCELSAQLRLAVVGRGEIQAEVCGSAFANAPLGLDRRF
jgi:hypothetical protein